MPKHYTFEEPQPTTRGRSALSLIDVIKQAADSRPGTWLRVSKPYKYTTQGYYWRKRLGEDYDVTCRRSASGTCFIYVRRKDAAS